MYWRRQFYTWVALSAVAVLMLVGIVSWEHKGARRWAVYLPAEPAQGNVLFNQKGCAHCHNDAAGGALALRGRASLASLSQLVTAMWNHAPRMRQAFQAQKLGYPSLSYEEASQLLAYLYMSGYADEPGDPRRGAQLFENKQCARCHGGAAGLSAAETPLAWTQALWNHASTMQAGMKEKGISWPRFQANELRDLLAYVRQAGGKSSPIAFVPADPDRGWELFQRKACLDCHALHRDSGGLGPELGAQRALPPTFSQFGEAMLNHFPEMEKAMQPRTAPALVFEGDEMAALASFLYSLHYLEPTGSPPVGRSVFEWRGCSACHGAQGDGTKKGPALRGTGRHYTAVRLASAFFQHGAEMLRESHADQQTWPLLKESDVGDLLAFLNTPVE